MHILTIPHPYMKRLLTAACLALCIPLVSVGQKPYGNFEEYPLDLLERPNLRWLSDREVVFPEGLVELWARGLERNDPQLSRLIVDSLATAHRRGLKEASEMAPVLKELASAKDFSPALALSIANTLVTFDQDENAELLAEMATEFGPTVAAVVEPALARWQSKVYETQWAQRLSTGTAGETSMIHAVDGLSAIRSSNAAELIAAILTDEKRTPSLRLVAANRFGSLQESDTLKIAKELKSRSDQEILNHLLAIQVLNHASDEGAIQFFRDCLAVDSNAVQSQAVANLYRIQPALVEERFDQLKDHTDVNIRTHLVNALADARSPEQMPRLAVFLNDFNPHLRRRVSEHLIELAESELRDSVIESVVEIQSKKQWQGCEQANYVLGVLKHLPAGARMVELLGHQRGEVKVSSAWGLNQLKLEEHLPAMLEHAQSIWDGFQSKQLNSLNRGMTLHQAFLFNAFGDQRYQPAKPLMRKYVPKNFEIGADARIAAVWALGMLHENDPETGLAAALDGRIKDNGQFPELEGVRNMAAVSLGRMKSVPHLDTLYQFADEGLAGAQWALHHMEGRELPNPSPNRVFIDDWFLSPVQSDEN